MWFPIILLFSVFTCSVGHSISKRETLINQQIEELIDDFNTLIISGGAASRPVNDISKKFEKKVKFLRLKGSFTASNGIVKDLSSLQRTGDATLSVTPTTATVTFHLGFRHLEVYYENYKAIFEMISVSGDVRLTVKTSSVFIQLRFVFEDEETCSTVVDRSYIEALDGFNVEVSNLGPLNWIFEKIADWVVWRFKEEIQQKLEAILTESLLKNKSINSFCKYIGYL